MVSLRELCLALLGEELTRLARDLAPRTPCAPHDPEGSSGRCTGLRRSCSPPLRTACPPSLGRHHRGSSAVADGRCRPFPRDEVGPRLRREEFVPELRRTGKDAILRECLREAATESEDRSERRCTLETTERDDFARERSAGSNEIPVSRCGALLAALVSASSAARSSTEPCSPACTPGTHTVQPLRPGNPLVQVKCTARQPDSGVAVYRAVKTQKRMDCQCAAIMC